MYKTNPDLEYSWLNGYNDAPNNLEVISEQEFWKNFGELQFYFHKWILKGHENVVDQKNINTVFFMINHGVAIGYVINIEKACRAKPKIYLRASECKHDFKHTSPRMFEQVYTCTKCDYSYSTDSSG